MNGNDSLCDKLVVSNVFVFRDETFSHLVILNGQLVFALHEMPKGPVEVEQPIEVIAQRGMLLCQLIEVIHSFIDLSLHHRYDSFCE